MASYNEISVQYPKKELILDDLVKYVNYEVKIIAFNSIGNGPPSTISSVYVGEAGMIIITTPCMIGIGVMALPF